MSVRVVFLILLAFTNIFSATVNGRSQYRFVRPALSGNAYGQSETLYKKPTHFKPISNDKFEETASFYELGERGAGGGGKLVKRQSDAPTGPPAVVNQTPTEEPATVTLTGNAHADGGIKPVNGPYSKFSIIDGYQGPSEHDGAGSKRSFQSWSEYLDARRSALLGGLSHYSNKRPSGYVPVINPDEHFRYMDKLFKAKNDKVRKFHELYLSMQKQGKKFPIGE